MIPLILLLFSFTTYSVPEISLLYSYDIQPNQVLCSHYGGYFHGRLTANGEVYNQWGNTCASPKLPLGTQLVLRVGKKYKKVIVNDRGPFATNNRGYAIWPLKPHPTRRLDLSKGVFQDLFGNLEQGIGNVEIVSVRFPVN